MNNASKSRYPESSRTTELPAFLGERCLQLLLFGGKGGVGKTTCSAATGLRLAQRFPEKSFLLVSTDPAHSLGDSLAGLAPPPNLQVLELDAGKCLEIFQAKHRRKLREIAACGTFLQEEEIDRLLDLSLPGLDELMAFLEISAWVEGRAYDCVIVDTAPAGHTLRLLEMPELIGKWLGALDSLLAKHRYMREVFARSRAPDELDLFLEELTVSVQAMQKLLRDAARCRFVPVMLAETLSVRETLALIGKLERLRLPITEVLVNRLYPENACPACAEARRRQMQALEELFRIPGVRRYEIFGMPLYRAEVRGRLLHSFWSGMARIAEPRPVLPRVSTRRPAPVERTARPLSPGIDLLLFGGKGGVGKTTLACAAGVWLSKAYPEAKVLLLSTDPAHSLADCLDVPVGPKPAAVRPCLAAMEIDARAEFRTLKQQYRGDLEEFFSSGQGNFDLGFDRQAMEKILDLAPPGLDEIMALSRVMDLLARGSYDVFVLDLASTGHMIRLLELPALLEDWLKVFFELLLKYQGLVPLRKFSGQLVDMSRNLKKLKKLLADPARACLYAVSAPAEMVLEETKDLVAACERLGVHVSEIFLNLATPPSDCPLCSALHQREELVRKRFRQAFAGKSHTVVYRQGELRGLERLEELGRALFSPAGKVACALTESTMS